MEKKYIKVMFDKTSGANKEQEYKLDGINVAQIWNPNGKEPRNMGGFNFSVPEKILRWLHRGDTLYDIVLPEDAEIVDVVESATPHGVFRSNKIILTNPRKVTDEMAMEFYKISTIPEEAYPKVLGAISIMGYDKTAKRIFKDKVNEGNIDLYLEEWNDFISHDNRKDCNTTAIDIDKCLNDLKSRKEK